MGIVVKKLTLNCRVNSDCGHHQSSLDCTQNVPNENFLDDHIS